MISKIVKVKNATGFNLHPAGMLCEAAEKYQSEIVIDKRGNRTNAKSLLSVLGAGVKYGDEITFFCDGPDEEEALAAMISIVESGLGE